MEYYSLCMEGKSSILLSHYHSPFYFGYSKTISMRYMISNFLNPSGFVHIYIYIINPLDLNILLALIVGSIIYFMNKLTFLILGGLFGGVKGYFYFIWGRKLILDDILVYLNIEISDNQMLVCAIQT